MKPKVCCTFGVFLLENCRKTAKNVKGQEKSKEFLNFLQKTIDNWKKDAKIKMLALEEFEC